MNKIPSVNLADFLCVDDLCSATMDNVFIYRDGGHLSHEGSAYLGKRFDFYGVLINAK